MSRRLPTGREPPETTILVEPQLNTAKRLVEIIFSLPEGASDRHYPDLAVDQ